MLLVAMAPTIWFFDIRSAKETALAYAKCFYDEESYHVLDSYHNLDFGLSVLVLCYSFSVRVLKLRYVRENWIQNLVVRHTTVTSTCPKLVQFLLPPALQNFPRTRLFWCMAIARPVMTIFVILDYFIVILMSTTAEVNALSYDARWAFGQVLPLALLLPFAISFVEFYIENQDQPRLPSKSL